MFLYSAVTYRGINANNVNRVLSTFKKLFSFYLRFYVNVHKKNKNEQDTNPKLFYGKIKNSIINWINEDNLKKYILTYQDAGFEHGGDGALFVYLRKKKF